MSAPLRLDALPDPWADRAALAAAAADCRAVRERLLARLAARLDSLHGEALGVRYWRIVLGPWLLYHLQQLEDRRRRVAQAKLKDAAVLAGSCFVVPRDTEEFLGLFQTERYNLQLLALALRDAGVAATETEVPADPAPRRGAPTGARALYHAVRRAVARTARALWPAEVLTDGVYPLGRRHAELVKTSGFRLWPFLDALPESLRVPAVLDERRRALADLPSEGPLERLAVTSLPSCLPALFLEGFPAARAHAGRALGRPPKVVLASVGWYYDELFKLCAAEAALSGARLVGFQHGGQYGTAAWSNPEWHERSITDAYFTWGWSEDARTVPAPAPWLCDAPVRDAHPHDLLLISASGLKVAHELFPAPMGAQWSDFFAWRGRFLDALGADGRDATRLRLFPKDYGWDERAEAARRWPDLRLDASRPMAESLRSAALVVTDHPGTTFNEVMAWDIPCLHFWEERLWESRPAAREAFAALRRAGILHDSPETASAKAREVLADPESWWRSAPVAEARAAFVARYARADRAWAAEWTRLLGGAKK